MERYKVTSLAAHGRVIIEAEELSLGNARWIQTSLIKGFASMVEIIPQENEVPVHNDIRIK